MQSPGALNELCFIVRNVVYSGVVGLRSNRNQIDPYSMQLWLQALKLSWKETITMVGSEGRGEKTKYEVVIRR